MADLTREDVLKLARLARLQLNEKEVQKFQTEISHILQYVEQLQVVELKELPPTNQVTGLTNVTRKDEVIVYGPTPQQLLANAPAIHDGQIKVRKIL